MDWTLYVCMCEILKINSLHFYSIPQLLIVSTFLYILSIRRFQSFLFLSISCVWIYFHFCSNSNFTNAIQFSSYSSFDHIYKWCTASFSLFYFIRSLFSLCLSILSCDDYFSFAKSDVWTLWNIYILTQSRRNVYSFVVVVVVVVIVYVHLLRLYLRREWPLCNNTIFSTFQNRITIISYLYNLFLEI